MPYATLITASELLQHIADPSVMILDCRGELLDTRAGAAAFAAGHLPGAQHADPDVHLSDKSPAKDGRFRGRHPLPSPEDFVATLRQWGINADTQVIVYDAHGGMFASRVWWMLRWIGHTKVALLDGGMAAWQAAGGAMSTDLVLRAPGSITLQTPLMRTVSVDEVMTNLETRQYIVLDARANDRFRGENETIDPVAGRIPGAKNRCFKDNLQADACFKPAEILRAEFRALIRNPQNTIAQCGSGISACHNLLAMEIAGLPGAALYPGSWSEWSSDPSRPVARGHE